MTKDKEYKEEDYFFIEESEVISDEPKKDESRKEDSNINK